MKKIVTTLIMILTVQAVFAQTIETELIKQINQLRLQMGGPDSGLSPFVRNSALDSAAMYHAKWVVASGIGGHVETKPAGGIAPLAQPWDRAAKYGVTAYCENLIQYNEYVMTGNRVDVKKTALSVFLCWKNSKGHYDNMLYTMSKKCEARIGIAIVKRTDGSFCIVMIVGANVDKYGNLIK